MKAMLLAFGIMMLFSTAIANADSSGRLKTQDPIEPRLMAIATQLRCPVCQGESIYDSHSTVATQMKSLIKEKISEGKTDAEIKDFFVERYGEFVLMEPRKAGPFLAIWLFPALALIAGTATILFVLFRRRTPTAPQFEVPPPTSDFIRRIEQLEP